MSRFGESQYLPLGCVLVGLGAASSPAFAQARTESVYNGRRILIPDSSIPRPDAITPITSLSTPTSEPKRPASGVETPGSLACVYQL